MGSRAKRALTRLPEKAATERLTPTDRQLCLVNLEPEGQRFAQVGLGFGQRGPVGVDLGKLRYTGEPDRILPVMPIPRGPLATLLAHRSNP